MQKRKVKKVEEIFLTSALMFAGVLIFKFLPMLIFGKEILFDASLHIILACFVLYVFYFFIEHDKNLRIFYFVFAMAIIIIISFQRIFVNAHNDVGLLLGLVISLISIIIPRWGEFRKEIEF